MKASKTGGRLPSILYQAAVLPWRQTPSIEIMLITSLGTGRWVIPKGGLMPGETPRAAAEREALEEAGLEGPLSLRALGSYYYEKQTKGLARFCSVEVYTMKVVLQRDTWPERNQRSTKWFSVQDAAAAINELDLRDLIIGFNSLGADPQ